MEELTVDMLLDYGFVEFKTNKELTIELYNDGESSSGYITCFDKTAPEIRLFIDLHERNGDWIPQNVSRPLNIFNGDQLDLFFFCFTGRRLKK